MSMEEIEWTESEGDTDDNLELENLDAESDDEQEFNRSLGGYEPVRTRRARDDDLDPEIEEAYQGARSLYTQGDYDGALLLLEEAIKHEANSKLLFNLLVSIHDERRDFEKALLARINVAALDKRDKDTWIDVGERSIALGHIAQAAWCFQQVSRLDRANWTWLRTRAELHMQIGQQMAALALLQRIRSKFFGVLDHNTKTQILLSIASALKELGRGDEALQIYMDLFVSATSPQMPGGEVDLDWQNLNILCELLTDQKKYARVVTVVKTGARYINGRGLESFWEQFSLETDAEFDGRRRDLVKRMTVKDRDSALASIEADSAAFDMPIDIRIWLLQARLKLIPPHTLLQARNAATLESLPSVQDALQHLGYLKMCRPIEMYSDLFKKGALAFFDARLYAESRDLYVALTGTELESEAEYLEMTVQVAKCEMELHNVSRAEGLYLYVLERDPSNQEALVAMGEIYAAANKKEESLKALKRLEALRSQEVESDNVFEHEQAVRDENAAPEARDRETASGNVFLDSSRQRPANARPSKAERAETERSAQATADAAFAGLARYQSGLEAGNTVASLEWLRFADELVLMFASHRKFFPVDKQKDFFEGSSNTSVDQRVERLRLVQLDSGDAGDEENNMAYVWRGQPLSMWFWVYMRSALVHAKAGHADRAQQVVSTAQAASVFRRRADTMQFVALSCAHLSRQPHLVVDLLRHLHTVYQFKPIIYRLYIALLSDSSQYKRDSLEVFAANNNQKFFLRQIKAIDSLVYHKKHVSGMAKVLDPEYAPQQEDPQLLMLYVYIMLLGPSYSPALAYLIRVRAILPDHPLVLLVYAVVQMHRVTQRTSQNRHLQLLEGLSFMQDYAARRGKAPEEQQEVRYNLGRFFHGVGLLSTAVKFYNEVFDFKVAAKYDLSREAAYNLHLIYAESGNMELSAEIVDKYLVI